MTPSDIFSLLRFLTCPAQPYIQRGAVVHPASKSAKNSEAPKGEIIPSKIISPLRGLDVYCLPRTRSVAPGFCMTPLRGFPNRLLNLPVPELDLVVPAVDQTLDDFAAGFRPAQKLSRNLIVLPLVENLEQRATRESADADVEGERDERVELVLVERDLDAVVHGVLGRHNVLCQKVCDLLLRQAAGVIDGHAGNVDRARSLFALRNQVAAADGRQSSRVLVDLKLETLPLFEEL